MDPFAIGAQKRAFEVDAEAQLLALGAELRAHRYRPGTSVCFVTGGPKAREVFAAAFRDRVVHHLLVSEQERRFEPRFIHDSYACRRGKGTLAASDRLGALLRKVSANGRRRAWALQLDVASFFPSIHKQTLFELLCAGVRDPELRWLTRVLLFHDPTSDYRFRSLRRGAPGPGEPGYPVPEEKSLFGKGNRWGLPIGNLTSQFWGNVYLDALDHFVKRELRCRYYLRYVDDLVLLSESRAQLLAWRAEIADFLAQRLCLRLRVEAKEIVPVSRGVRFVGWKSWWNRRLPRPRTLGRLASRLDEAAPRMLRPAFSGLGVRVALPRDRASGVAARPAPTRRRWNEASLQQLLASYSGHLRHGGSWRAWQRTMEGHGWLDFVLCVDGWGVARRWKPQAQDPEAARLRFGDAYRRCVRPAGEQCLVFWPVGRFVEFYAGQRLLAERVLGLRRTVLPRGGYVLVAGFPRWLAPRYAARALHAGVAVALVGTSSSGRGWPTAAGTLLIPGVRAGVAESAAGAVAPRCRRRRPSESA